MNAMIHGLIRLLVVVVVAAAGPSFKIDAVKKGATSYFLFWCVAFCSGHRRLFRLDINENDAKSYLS